MVTKVEVWNDLPKELREAIDKFADAHFECGQWDARWSDRTWEDTNEEAAAACNVLVAEIVKAIQAAKEEGVQAAK